MKSEPMECRRCGVCCTKHQASAGPEEIERITAFLGITPEDWADRYDDPRWGYGDYRLIRHVKSACAFLKYAGGLAACAIYPVRPACCAAWQPAPERKECREGMRKRGARAANEKDDLIS